jgi:hypothetical protein
MWGKTKIKMMSFCFAIAPFVVVSVSVLPLKGTE